MLKLKKTAITGGIASGKSSVAQIFKNLGAYVVSADEIVHWHLSNNRELIKMIEKLLGPGVVSKGCVNRKAVADKVFKHPELLKSLEDLIHPYVKKDIDIEYETIASEGKAPLFTAEIPVLYEAEGFESNFDAVIVVDAPKETRRKRYGGDDFDQRESCQMPLEEKVKKADFVIHNDKNIDHLKKQAKTIYQKLTSP
jgi:dephospho-CoA kinase